MTKYRVTIYNQTAWFTELWQALDFFFLYARFKVTSSPEVGPQIKLYKNKKLICYSGWNNERYRKSGWYGNELVVCKGIPNETYKTLMKYIYYNIYSLRILQGEVNGTNPVKEWHDEISNRIS